MQDLDWMYKMGKKIEDYNFPDDLKGMDEVELQRLAFSIRKFLLEKISVTGGHLASNLGVVELSIALHKVFDSPKDKIIWDVGHQSYVHKILTGRASGFDSLRQLDGMSGFPKTKESVHDFYDAGHSSTSISIASGMAAARDIKGDDYQVIAVIGDGALTGGMAYEAINNLGEQKSKVIIIVNDNGMSISPNKGGISDHLGKLRTSSKYKNAKKHVKSTVEKIPAVGPTVSRYIGDFKDVLKYAFVQGGVLFEELGVTYIGPIDGHSFKDITEALRTAKRADGPVVLHVMTKKGKGYYIAEENPDKFHGISAFDTSTGLPIKESEVSFSKVFGNKLVKMAETNKDIVAISAAMCDATGLKDFHRKYPERFFDVGIAEAHGVTFGAGLAINGLKPYIAIYSTFLQRAYDQILEDICLQKLPVVLAIDRAGIVGADGETHHGIFDLSYLLPMPEINVFAPATGKQMEEILEFTETLNEPAALRYPRGKAFMEPEIETFEGKNIRIAEGKDGDILAVGTMLQKALEAKELLLNDGIDMGIINICALKSKGSFDNINLNKKLQVTVEDNVVIGGFGEFYKDYYGIETEKTVNIGWPDSFVEHGDVESLYSRYGLDGKGIAERIRKEFEGKA